MCLEDKIWESTPSTNAGGEESEFTVTLENETSYKFRAVVTDQNGVAWYSDEVSMKSDPGRGKLLFN